MSIFLRDVIHSVRLLRSKPGIALVAAVSLALGIAANTTIFSIMNATFLSPVSLPQADRIVTLSTYPASNPQLNGTASVPEYEVWKERAQSFEHLGAMFAGTQSRTLGAEGDGRPAEQLAAFAGQVDVLHAWGVQPLLGRLFTDEEDRVGEPASVVLISHRFWQRRFGGDPGALGQTLVLDGTPATIIGVMPEGLAETILRPNIDLWIPWQPAPAMMISAVGFNQVYARLRPGVSIEQAQTEMDAIAAQLARERPDTHENRGIRVRSLQEAFYGGLREPLLMLQGAVVLVLLIACANVAVLLLAAASSRQIEVGLRSALGAVRGRIVRQVLTESLVLAALGGILGLALAWMAVQLFVALAPPGLPGLERVAIDRDVLAFTAVVVVLTAVLFGLVPAFSSSRPNLSGLLNETPRGSTGGSARKRLQLGLVTAQTALALILLIGAGLLTSSFVRLQANPLGGDPEGILSFRLGFAQDEAITFTGEQYQGVGLWEVNPNVAATFEQVHERLRAVPGVESVAGSYILPFAGAMGMQFQREGQASPASSEPPGALNAAYLTVTPEYFPLLRVPVLRGRNFTAQDRVTSPPVVIINETMARQYWPDEDPIGRYVTLQYIPDEPSREIVGVVGDMMLSRFQQEATPALYMPYAQQDQITRGPSAVFLRAGKVFLLRTAGDPMSLVPSVRNAVAEVLPDKPLTDIQTLEQVLGNQIQGPRFFAALLGIFGIVAGILAAAGLYAAISYAVAERGREIGIRMALGAARSAILRLVMRQAASVIAIGLLIGLVGALALTRLLAAALFGVTPTDALTYTTVTLMLVVVALLACLVPTRRAMTLDPAVTLRNDR